MTGEDQLLLNELKANVQQLFRQYGELRAEKDKLDDTILVLTQKIARLEQEKNELGQQIDKIKLANRILSGKDEDGEAKKRINTLIREIDKCIALLNR